MSLFNDTTQPKDEIPLHSDIVFADHRPLCWACGWPMEWTGEEREIESEGGFITAYEPIYECVNPDCREDEE